MEKVNIGNPFSHTLKFIQDQFCAFFSFEEKNILFREGNVCVCVCICVIMAPKIEQYTGLSATVSTTL